MHEWDSMAAPRVGLSRVLRSFPLSSNATRCPSVMPLLQLQTARSRKMLGRQEGSKWCNQHRQRHRSRGKSQHQHQQWSNRRL